MNRAIHEEVIHPELYRQTAGLKKYGLVTAAAFLQKHTWASKRNAPFLPHLSLLPSLIQLFPEPH